MISASFFPMTQHDHAMLSYSLDGGPLQQSLTALWCALAIAACAGSSANLNPTHIAPDRGAIAGHIVVNNHQQDVTQSCIAVFSGRGGQRTNIQLAADGWVFTTLARGAARIEAVSCTLDRRAKFRVEDVSFNVPGNDVVAYFGHLTVNMTEPKPSTGSAVAAGLVAGGVGAALAGEPGEAAFQHGTMKLDSRVDYAARTYAARYGRVQRVANTMKYPKQSVLSARLAQKPDVEMTETNLDGLKLMLFGVPRSQPDRVVVRFEHLVRKAELQDCTALALTLDDARGVYTVEQHAAGDSNVIEESVQGQLDFQVVQALASAERVELDLCGLTRTLDRPARHATQEFVRRFQLRAQRQ
jgi:hypothetical protein